MINVGIIGCGNISTRYLLNAPLFRGIMVRAATDIRSEVAEAQCKAFGIEAVPLDAFLKRKDIDVVINLTVPNAHFDVTMKTLRAGKHVFSEKPLSVSLADGRKLVEEAKRRRVQLAVAPDTFLGPGHRTARRLIDEGKVGRILAGTAFVMSRGMEHWHPDPTFFFKPGGGPVLDMGPYYITALVNLIGPVKRVIAMTSTGIRKRVVTSKGPMTGKSIKVETPTHCLAVLEFAQGALVSLHMSWEVYKHGNRPIELHGTEGSLRVPDPNFYGGQVEFTEGRGDWQVVDVQSEPLGRINYPDTAPLNANYRMLGVAELAAAVAARRAPRPSGALGLHVLEVMQAVLTAGRTGRSVAIASGVRPKAISAEEIKALLVDPKAVAA